MQALDPTARANIVKWRSLANSGRKMSSTDLVKSTAPEKEAPTEKEKTRKDKANQKPFTKGGKRERRMSTVAQTGLPDGAIRIRFNDSDNLFYLPPIYYNYAIPSHDSRILNQASSLLQTQVSLKIRIVKKGTTCMSTGHQQPEPYAF